MFKKVFYKLKPLSNYNFKKRSHGDFMKLHNINEDLLDLKIFHGFAEFHGVD